MLEVKGLKKQYKPKKGEIVKALDGVDLAFPDKGMIFILGKSGSGKSTMLNLLGGLDTYDDGEIIIKGKSSKKFSQSEFDSYRNTYLGFIFQSYNVLDEFSVGDNIALAIELQHEKATKQRIDDILKQVDLEGFAHRKPRELSGGQKQRVAIARALVKNPEIILADEPTGALDSTTGIAVFDTLKSLSKEKLVIIVSHDREFAENYGDRVIEFKDGKIISDIIKYPVENVKLNENVALYDNQAIKIKKGYQLTVKDLEEINKQISKSNEDVYISLNQRTSEAAKTAARINDEGASEAFKDTKKEDIIVNKKDVFTLKKSRLGLKNSVRIGASGLKVKPGRLIITMILAICSFTLFGISDTMGSYNGSSVTYNTFVDAGVNNSGIQKYQITDNGKREVDVTESDVKYFKDTFGVDSIIVYEESLYFSNYLTTVPTASYYMRDVAYGVSLTQAVIDELGFTLTGNLPTAKDEIVLTQYMYEHFEVGGYKDDGDTEKTISSHTDLIGLTIGDYEIVGILDTLLDSTKYEDLKDATNDDWISGMLFEGGMSSELHSMVVYHEDVFADVEEVTYLDTYYYGTFNITDISTQMLWGNYIYKNDNNNIKYFDSNKTSLADDEMIVSFNNFRELYWEKFNDVNLDVENEINTFVDTNVEPIGWDTDGWKYVRQDADYWSSIDENMRKNLLKSHLLYNEGFFDNSFDTYYPTGMDIAFDVYLTATGISNAITGTFDLYDAGIEGKSMKIVGVTSNFDSGILVSDNLYAEFEKELPTSGYTQVILILPTDEAKLKELVEFVYETDKYTYDFTCMVHSTISMANGFIEDFTSIFLYIGIFFAAFSSLLLFNFISVSISYKQKEIGILRAIGARSKDVFGIFFSETLIIGFINFLFACIGVFIACNFINTYLREDVGVAMSLLNPNVRQIALIFGVSLLVSFISSFFPVYKIAIKRPIESIRQG